MAETVWMAVHFLLQRFSDVGYSVTLLSVVMQSLTTCPQQFMLVSHTVTGNCDLR